MATKTLETEVADSPACVDVRTVQKIIRTRRSIFADSYTGKEIPENIIREVLTNAIWAPTYKMTQPWRFVVLQGQQKAKFGFYMAEYYKFILSSNEFPPDRYRLALEYPGKASCMIAIVMQRSTKIEIEEWEELAAVSCAVQNMWLTCTAYEIGGYWDSCKACIEYGKELGLSENERCLGFFYMGYYDKANFKSKKKRSPLESKVQWLK